MENNHNNQNYLGFNIICQFAIDVLRNHEINISQLLIPLYFGNLLHDIPHKSTCTSVRFFDMSTCCFHTDLLNFCMYISLPSEVILEQRRYRSLLEISRLQKQTNPSLLGPR